MKFIAVGFFERCPAACECLQGAIGIVDNVVGLFS